MGLTILLKGSIIKIFKTLAFQNEEIIIFQSN